MLGKLTRFLRFFGYDTLYRLNETEKEMLIHSLSEDRIILSRSRSLLEKSKKLTDVVYIKLLLETYLENLKAYRRQFYINKITDTRNNNLKSMMRYI